MKHINLLLFFAISSLPIKAQQATNISGGSGAAGNFIIDWNFGELTLIDANSANSMLVTQGLLQPDKGIYDETVNTISAGELKILPNPTNGILKVWTGFLTPGKLVFEFFDAKGSSIITEQKIYTGFNIYEFILDKYAAAAYPLKVTWQPTSGKIRKANFIIIKQ
jgi:hypothetical protein